MTWSSCPPSGKVEVRRLRLPVFLWKRSGRRVKGVTSTCSSHTAPCLHHAAHAAKDMRVCRVRVCRPFSNFFFVQTCACSHRPATRTGLINTRCVFASPAQQTTPQFGLNIPLSMASGSLRRAAAALAASELDDDIVVCRRLIVVVPGGWGQAHNQAYRFLGSCQKKRRRGHRAFSCSWSAALPALLFSAELYRIYTDGPQDHRLCSPASLV